ncbi:MAG TPA: tol-pal system protein YbgF [candidate division Zixibacteria bacterium]|nr:tol-pal system protein YbgF [candidate division Zixibacteria bacterium]
MINRKNATMTAILTMAVLVLGIWLGGCATSRQVRELQADVARVEGQIKTVNTSITHTDSLIQAGSEADNRLRADLRSDMDALRQQMAALLESYNDLMQQVSQLGQREIRVIGSSPGASEDRPANPPTSTDTPPPVTPPTTTAPHGIDCTALYDTAFLTVRRGEYETAIAQFRDFLDQCPDHENIENAHYWIGESYYATEKYVDAINELDKMIKDYQGSPQLGRALFKLARSHQELDHKDEAKRLFQELIDDYPNTLEAEQAKEQLKILK